MDDWGGTETVNVTLTYAANGSTKSPVRVQVCVCEGVPGRWQGPEEESMSVWAAHTQSGP